MVTKRERSLDPAEYVAWLEERLQGWIDACKSQGLPIDCSPESFVRHHRNNAAVVAHMEREIEVLKLQKALYEAVCGTDEGTDLGRLLEVDHDKGRAWLKEDGSGD